LSVNNKLGDAQVIVIGGGLAGSEAAWQIASRGVKVALYELILLGLMMSTMQ